MNEHLIEQMELHSDELAEIRRELYPDCPICGMYTDGKEYCSEICDLVGPEAPGPRSSGEIYVRNAHWAIQ